jgi:hypothetical protein
MKEIFKKKSLLAAACISFIVAFIEGYQFYGKYEAYTFFRIIFTIQNSAQAFLLKPSISIGDVLDSLSENPSFLQVASAYAYGFVVLLAPICTGSAIVMAIRVLLRKKLPIWWRGSPNERILIFGYTDNVKNIIHNLEKRKQWIFIIADAEITDEENYKLAQKGVVYYSHDFLNMKEKEQKKLLKKIKSEQIQQIFLMEDSSVKNFSLYMELCEEKITLRDDAICRCLCEDLGVNKMIEDYYTTKVNEQKSMQNTPNIPIPLKVFSLSELKAVQLFTEQTESGQQMPYLYYYNLKEIEDKSEKEKTESKYWNVHMLLAGCGQLGQQVLYQTINQCVMHSESTVIIDIVDIDAAQIEDVVIKRFNTDYLRKIPGQNAYCIKGDAADGELYIRFHTLNTRTKSFTELLERSEKDGLFTCAAICLNDSDLCIQCMNELENYFQRSIKFQKRTHKPTIAVRLEMDSRIVKYLRENNDTYSNVVPFAENKKVLTLENIAKTEIEQKAQEFNGYYDYFGKQLHESKQEQLVYSIDLWKIEKEKGVSEWDKIQKSWKKLDYFLGESNRNACLHQTVKKAVIEAQYGSKWYEKVFWKQYDSAVSIDIRDIEKDQIVKEMLRIEHRRWNYSQASDGWGYPAEQQLFDGVKEPDARLHKCMTNWECVKQDYPDKCIYDLIPYLILYKEAMSDRMHVNNI